nr:hypothetical protein B0A51_17181 [Rachicladosporium sp. CCFEE 5018]
MSDLDEDKKRNKLGYQRISIACAHCRRRKIRCVLADGDDQNRCQNCIRLRKECIFYPVDQQNAIDNQSQSSMRGSSDATQLSGPSPSPQELNTGRPFERIHQFGSLPSLPSNAPPFNNSPVPLDPSDAYAAQGGPPHQRVMHDGFNVDAGRMSAAQYAFQMQNNVRPPWEHSSPIRSQSQNTERSTNEMSAPHWRSSGLQAQFSPFPVEQTEMSHSGSTPAYAYAPSHPQTWPISPSHMAGQSAYASLQDSVQQPYNPNNSMYAPQPHLMGAHQQYAGFDIQRSASHPPVLSVPVSTSMGQFQQPPHPYMFQQHSSAIDSPLPQHGFSTPWNSGTAASSASQQDPSPSSTREQSGSKRSR